MAPGINTALEIDPSLEIIQSHVVCLSGSWAWQAIDRPRSLVPNRKTSNT